jgi:peptide deformylase
MLKIIKSKKKLSIPVEEGSIQDNSEAVARMLKFVTNTHIGRNSIGLASNQLGLKGRVILVKIYSQTEEFDYGWSVFINPVIVSHSERMMPSIESCLSIPNKDVVVSRYDRIDIVHENLFGEESKPVRFYGQDAIVFQHEIDHLNGILMTDRRKEQLNEHSN